MKTLNSFLMTQRQVTLKNVCHGMWVCRPNVRKLHRPRMSDAFLADSVDMYDFSYNCTTFAGCSWNCTISYRVACL